MNGSTPEYRALLFNVRRSIRYHSRRQRHYQNAHNGVLFSALVLSSASVVALATELGTDIGQAWGTWVPLLPGALVSGLIGFDFVAGSLQKAGLYANFVRQFTDLERQLVTSGDELSVVADVTDKMLEIESSEPPVLRVLDTLCYNELTRAMGYPEEEQIEVGRLQRLFADFFDLRAHTLVKP